MVGPDHPKWEGAAFAFFYIVMTGYAMLFLWAWGNWMLDVPAGT